MVFFVSGAIEKFFATIEAKYKIDFSLNRRDKTHEVKDGRTARGIIEIVETLIVGGDGVLFDVSIAVQIEHGHLSKVRAELLANGPRPSTVVEAEKSIGIRRQQFL